MHRALILTACLAFGIAVGGCGGATSTGRPTPAASAAPDAPTAAFVDAYCRAFKRLPDEYLPAAQALQRAMQPLNASAVRSAMEQVKSSTVQIKADLNGLPDWAPARSSIDDLRAFTDLSDQSMSALIVALDASDLPGMTRATEIGTNAADKLSLALEEYKRIRSRYSNC